MPETSRPPKSLYARLCREEEAVDKTLQDVSMKHASSRGSVNEIAFDELIATAVE
ncbi:hypothetical protein ANAPC5_01173 [Anaplasma phagocytophilum]|nr:hypothetical protein ANAPC5_01173 [Anaplasma phagocytophilum]